MRRRLDYLVPVAGYVGALFWIFGFVIFWCRRRLRGWWGSF